MIYEAHETRWIKGRLKKVAVICNDLKTEGYEIKKVKRKIKWPYFWIHKYKVKMSRCAIVDVNDIIQTPIADLQ